MSRRAMIFTVALGLAVHALLAAGALAFLPGEARVALAFLVLVMLPGYAAVARGVVPPGGAWLAPGWALGFGVAWLGALVLATRAFHQPFTVLIWGALAANAVLWTLGLVRPPARTAGRVRVVESPAAPRWTRAARVALLLAAAIGAGYAGRLGAPLGMHTDSPDHIGTIRRMLASGDAFPRDAFFADAGEEGIDPRKGLWHPEVALITRLSATDPLFTWAFLPACLVPLFVLNVAVIGFLLRGPPGAALAGWAYLLTYGGSLADGVVREAGFATKLGDQLALATAAAVLADLARPSRQARFTAVGLALGALAAHVYYIIQFAMVLPALALGLAIADRGLSARVRRVVMTSVTIALAALPYLMWRLHGTYAPVNIIHTEPQGLLWLNDHLRVVSIGVLWAWLGNGWLLFVFGAAWLWRAGRREPAVLYLVTTALAVALVIFDPPVVAWLEPRLGYLLMRMIWMVPLAPALAWMVLELAADLRHGPGRPRALALLLALVLLFLGPLRDAAQVLTHSGAVAAAERPLTAAPWSDALRWMQEHLPPGSVVLSDPATSYSIPEYTHHYVMTLADQHSSPNDAHALRRILDSRDALDPYSDATTVRAVLEKYRVDVIALNNRFRSPPALDYWTPMPSWFDAERARLDAAPQAFERLYDRDGFVVYRVQRGALDSLPPPPPRPFVIPWQAGIGPPGILPPGRALDPELPALSRFALLPGEGAPGDTLHGVAYWRALRPMAPGCYSVAVRFDRPLPGRFRPPAALGKPVRKLIERVHGERYRFREDHIPVGGEYGVDLWTPGQVVRDTFTITVPRDVAAGEYQVGIRMLVGPHYANYRLSDYFFDDDIYSGIHVGAFTVRRGPAEGGH
jgi:hypothetical protein